MILDNEDGDDNTNSAADFEWKDQYYKERFEGKLSLEARNGEFADFHHNLRKTYLEGLAWVMKYYFRGWYLSISILLCMILSMLTWHLVSRGSGSILIFMHLSFRIWLTFLHIKFHFRWDLLLPLTNNYWVSLPLVRAYYLQYCLHYHYHRRSVASSQCSFPPPTLPSPYDIPRISYY